MRQAARSWRIVPPAAAVLIVSGLGGCSYFAKASGAFADGGRLFGTLTQSGLSFRTPEGVDCGGGYSHRVLWGQGTISCRDGRTGDFTLRSDVSHLLSFGPGPGSGEGAGQIGGRPFRFTFGPGTEREEEPPPTPSPAARS